MAKKGTKLESKGAAVVDTFELPYSPEDVEKTPKSYIPEGFKTVEDYLADAREQYALDIEEDDHNRREALSDKEFVAGKQWDPIVLENRKGLPCLVINSIPQFTAQVVGDWRSNRNSVKVLPSEDGDIKTAEIRSDLIRAIEMKSRADRVYDNAFESMLQCGDGAFRVTVDYAREDVFDQELRIKPIDDSMAVVWDRLSIDPTGRDATHVFVDDRLPRKEFERRWKEEMPSTLHEDARFSLYADGWYDQDSVRVTEHWRMIERQKILGLFENGSVKEVTQEAVMALGNPLKIRVAQCRYAQMHLITGWKILAGPYEWKLDRLPIIRMSGRVVNVAGKRCRHGMVRFMKDAARLRNFWRSVAAEQLGYAPKAQWLATAEAIEGREDAFRKAHLTRDPLLVANDEAVFGQNLMRVEPPAIETALLNEAAQNVQDMKDVTGIHDASLGIRSNETSGRAIHARQREGDIANLTYHDNGNAALLECGDVLNQLIGQTYDSTRVLRIVGEDQEAKLILVNNPYDPNSPDLSVGNYDVALSTGPSYTTRRVEAAQAMMEAVQVYPEMMQVAGDLVAKAQDWPGAQELAERLKKTIPPQFLDEEDQQGQQMGPQIDPQMMMELQANLQQLAQENEQLKMKLEDKEEEIEIKAYEAETKRLQVIAQAKNNMAALHQKTIDDASSDPDITPKKSNSDK